MSCCSQSPEDAVGGGEGLGLTQVDLGVEGNINLATLAAGATIDGVVSVAGMSLMVDQQSTPSQNGLYQINAAAPATRLDGWTTAADFVPGRRVGITQGRYHTGRVYEVEDVVGTIGVDSINFDESFRPGHGGRDLYFYTDFIGSSSLACGLGGSFGGIQFNSQIAGTGAWGELRLRTSPAFTSSEVFAVPRIQTFAANTIGDYWFECECRIEDLPVAANDYIIRLGQNVFTFTDGIYFQFSIASANWRCITRAASVEENNDSGVAAVAGTTAPGPRFSYKVESDLSQVQFFINRTRVALNTLNIPGASAQEVGVKQIRVAADAEVGSRYDWMLLHGKRAV